MMMRYEECFMSPQDVVIAHREWHIVPESVDKDKIKFTLTHSKYQTRNTLSENGAVFKTLTPFDRCIRCRIVFSCVVWT